MIYLISPAKSLNMASESSFVETFPIFLDQSQKLINKLKKQSVASLQKLMSISNKLALENQQRYRDFSLPFTKENTKAAAFAFAGDVYRGLNIRDFNATELDFAQNNIRILSGLYGLLKPLDGIQPYRLEMGRTMASGRAKNLYQLWTKRITESLIEELQHHDNKTIVNLASKEYFKAIDLPALAGNVLQVNFFEKKDGAAVFVSFHAKKARGLMCQYAAKQAVRKPDDLTHFNLEGYAFDETLSNEKEYIFTR